MLKSMVKVKIYKSRHKFVHTFIDQINIVYLSTSF